MNKIEEIHLLEELLKKHDLPISPILEYTIKQRENEYCNISNLSSNIQDIKPVFEVYKEPEDYLNEFSNLAVAVVAGRKLPHKAILLLSIMDMIEKGILINNEIPLDHSIVENFTKTWLFYFCNSKIPTVWTPFYHLKGESFWHFKSNGDEEKLKLLISFGGTPSIGKMRLVIKYAYIDETLFKYLRDSKYRKRFRSVLIKNYINCN